MPPACIGRRYRRRLDAEDRKAQQKAWLIQKSEENDARALQSITKWLERQPRGEARVVLLATAVHTGQPEVFIHMNPPEVELTQCTEAGTSMLSYDEAQIAQARAKKKQQTLYRRRQAKWLNRRWDCENQADPTQLSKVYAWISGIPGSFIEKGAAPAGPAQLPICANRRERRQSWQLRLSYATALQRGTWREDEEILFCCVDCGDRSENDENCSQCFMPMCGWCMQDEQKYKGRVPEPAYLSMQYPLCDSCLEQGTGQRRDELRETWDKTLPHAYERSLRSHIRSPGAGTIPSLVLDVAAALGVSPQTAMLYTRATYM